MHSQQMFNECIARHLDRRHIDESKFRVCASSFLLLIMIGKGSPPSSALAEGIVGHQTASSSEALRRI